MPSFPRKRAFTRPLIRMAITRMYGEGVGGFVANAVADRALDELRRSSKRHPEILDVSQLRPGETYTVTTRPTPTRRERKLTEAHGRARGRLEKAEQPSRDLRKAEQELRKAEKRLGKTRAGSKKEKKATAAMLQQAARVEQLRHPSKKVVKLRAQVAMLDAALVAVRERAMAKSRKSARPARRHQFH